MKKKIIIRLFFILAIIPTFFSCSSIPKNEIGKEKVVLVHGYGRSPSAMWKMEEFLEKRGYQVYTIGYSSFTQDIDGIKNEFYQKVDKHLASAQNEKVHFVGHSMGGLLIRSYLGDRDVANIGNTVIMGSPNKGTPVVEALKDKWYFSLAGPAVNSLSSNGSPFLASLKKPDYNLGVIAGVIHKPEYESVLPGKDDGLVPFESTKVEGMKDFITLPVSHYHLRLDQIVFYQTLHFLREGRFLRSKVSKVTRKYLN